MTDKHAKQTWQTWQHNMSDKHVSTIWAWQTNMSPQHDRQTCQHNMVDKHVSIIFSVQYTILVLGVSAGPQARCTFQTAGPHFDLVRARTDHLDKCRAIRFQIMLARTITKCNLTIYFSRGQFSRSPVGTARRQRGASLSRTCQSTTLTSVMKHSRV